MRSIDVRQNARGSHVALMDTPHPAQSRLQAFVWRSGLAAAGKNSSTSSKPPSSDIVKPPPGQEKRTIGGQLGHPKHERTLFPPEALTSPPHCHTIEICPDCGHGLDPADGAPRVVQQIDNGAPDRGDAQAVSPLIAEEPTVCERELLVSITERELTVAWVPASSMAWPAIARTSPMTISSRGRKMIPEAIPWDSSSLEPRAIALRERR